MGTITVNVNDSVEKLFRKMVKQKYGTHKGSLGRAITDAFKSWINKMMQKEIKKRQLNLMDRGISFGKVDLDREKIHER